MVGAIYLMLLSPVLYVLILSLYKALKFGLALNRMYTNLPAIGGACAMLSVECDNIGHEILVLRFIDRSPRPVAPNVHAVVFAAARYRVCTEEHDAANRPPVGDIL